MPHAAPSPRPPRSSVFGLLVLDITRMVGRSVARTSSRRRARFPGSLSPNSTHHRRLCRRPYKRPYRRACRRPCYATSFSARARAPRCSCSGRDSSPRGSSSCTSAWPAPQPRRRRTRLVARAPAVRRYPLQRPDRGSTETTKARASRGRTGARRPGFHISFRRTRR
eukprot:scaffold1569_cov266-Pinguiococcus_pyrenoidosus.AAC.7